MSEGYVVCRSYTRARRHPLVVGHIGGWQSPWPLTPTQIAAIVVTALALLKTRGIWGVVLPGGFLHLLVLAGCPVAAAWAVRHLRIEGRTPLQAAQGGMTYLLRARAGKVRGRAARRARPVVVSGRIFVAA